MREGWQLHFDAAASAYGELWEAAYDPDVRRSFQSSHRTIKEIMLSNLEGPLADSPLIYYADRCITHRQADRQACKLANALIDCGVSAGERIALVISNRPEIVVAFMACYKAGFVATPFNPRSARREIADAIGHVSATTAIVEHENLSKVLFGAQTEKGSHLKRVVVIDKSEQTPHPEGKVSLLDYDLLLQGAKDHEPTFDVKPHDNAILLFTGGTTGVSKGCCQTHEKMMFEIQAMHHWVASAFKTLHPSFLICMPMTHIMGINYGIHWQIINGGSVVIAQGYKPPDIIDAFERYHPTAWAAVPTLLHSVVYGEALSKSPYRDLELVIFGGSFIAKELIESLIAKTDARFVESYGMSESFGFVTCNPVKTMGKVGSIGLPISDTDVLIVDATEGDRVLGPGEKGEIVFRGPQVLQEYWENPRETKQAIRDGWLFSGDIGYMDADGFFYLVDRKKDIIVVSGFNVSPNEIDEILMSCPSIVDACTIGMPDDHSGERPKSFIVLADGAKIKEADIVSYCKEWLAPYKVPRHFEVVSEIPKTKAKKPDRSFLRREEGKKMKKLM